jgi:hypothetical protein
MFRAFVNRAYEKHADALTKLEGNARAQKIKDFSVFIRDVMLQFADMNNMDRFSLTIRTQAQALEEKFGIVRSKTTEAAGALKREVTQP